jgi:tetratricopeptide (TPR) repeat protein
MMVLSDMWATYDGADLLESMITGNFAYDVLNGLWRGWNSYLGDTYFHTGLAIIPSLIALVLYCVLGQSLFTLCQVPILFSIAIIFMIYRLCAKYFSGMVAVIAVFFYVFLPLRIQQWVIYPYCDLLETSFYTLLGLSLFLFAHELYQDRSKKKKWQITAVVLFGLVSGLGVFHCEIYLFMLVSIFAVALLHKPKFILSRHFVLYFLLAFLVGLIPYLVFSPTVSPTFIISWFRGKFVLGEEFKIFEYKSQTLHGAIDSLFWFVKLVSLNLLKGWPLLIVGSLIGINPQRAFRYRSPEDNSTLAINIIRTFTFFYAIVTISSSLFNESYVYPAVAYFCILFAIIIRDVFQTVEKSKLSILRILVLSIVISCCSYNCFQILKDISPKRWKGEFLRLTTIRGCNFYWPFGYYAASGYKTRLTKIVEENGKKAFNNHIFSEPDPTSVTIDGESHSIKTICVNRKNNRLPYRILKDDGYWSYGIDVTFKGLGTLAQEIQVRGFSKEAEGHAFVSLAVHYNSNYSIKHLLKSYENNIPERIIPSSYRKYFYHEFGRRLRSKYEVKKADDLIQNLKAEFKSEILAGYEMADHYFKAPSYSRLIQGRTSYADIYYNLGNKLQSQGKYEDAIVHYNLALQLTPDNAEIHNNLGIVLKKQGKLDEAINHYHRALKLRPDYARAHNNLGSALLAQKKLDEAIDSFRRALQINPDYEIARKNLDVAIKVRNSKTSGEL